MYNKHLLHCMVSVSLGSGHSPLREETQLLLYPSSKHNKKEILVNETKVGIKSELNRIFTVLEKKIKIIKKDKLN